MELVINAEHFSYEMHGDACERKRRKTETMKKEK